MSALLKTVEQNRAIFGLGHKLSMETDDLRDLAEDVSGGRTRSLKEITFDEANAIIVRLGGEAFPPDGSPAVPRRTVNHRKQQAGVVTLASPAHLKKMDDLAAARGISPEGLERMCFRMLRSKRPKTAKGCNAVIEALKSMAKRERRVSSPDTKEAA